MRRSILLSVLVVASLWPAVAQATLVPSMSVRRMALEADSVVRGEVVGEEVVWDGQRAQVYTHTTVRVAEALVGRARIGELVVVRQMGGVLDGLETRIVGTATLALGAEVVIFARTDGAFHYLVGMAQGMWGVMRRPGEEPVLTRGLAGLRMTPFTGATDKPAPSRLSLQSLRSDVAQARAELEVLP